MSGYQCQRCAQHSMALEVVAQAALGLGRAGFAPQTACAIPRAIEMLATHQRRAILIAVGFCLETVKNDPIEKATDKIRLLLEQCEAANA